MIRMLHCCIVDPMKYNIQVAYQGSLNPAITALNILAHNFYYPAFQVL